MSLRAGMRGVARSAVPWLERLARFGYACKGVMYVTLGVIALRAAVVPKASTADPRGALERLGEGPLGQLLLVVLALGLVGYALWQGARALLDPEGQGAGPKGLGKRLGYGLSAGAYLALSWFALVTAANGRAVGRDGHGEEEWTARLMAQPLGDLLVGAVGAVLLGAAANQLYVAWGAHFMRRISFGCLDDRLCHVLTRTGQVGIAARGVVAAIIGGFLVQAAWEHDPERAGGVSEALALLERAPLGSMWLGLVAVGVVAYGAYALVQGRYRHIRLRGPAPR